MTRAVLAIAAAGLLSGMALTAAEAQLTQPCRMLKDGAEIRGAITKASAKHENGQRIEFYRMTFASPLCVPHAWDEKKKVLSTRVHVVPDGKGDQTKLEAAVKSGRAVTVNAKQYMAGHTAYHMAPIVALGSRVVD